MRTDGEGLDGREGEGKTSRVEILLGVRALPLFPAREGSHSPIQCLYGHSPRQGIVLQTFECVKADLDHLVVHFGHM